MNKLIPRSLEAFSLLRTQRLWETWAVVIASLLLSRAFANAGMPGNKLAGLLLK